MPAEASPRDIGQRGYSLALKRLSEMKATNIAEAMGMSDSTVSTLKNEVLEKAILMLAHLGIKCVPSTHRCVDQAVFDFMTFAVRQTVEQRPALLWGDEQDE